MVHKRRRRMERLSQWKQRGCFGHRNLENPELNCSPRTQLPLALSSQVRAIRFVRSLSLHVKTIHCFEGSFASTHVKITHCCRRSLCIIIGAKLFGQFNPSGQTHGNMKSLQALRKQDKNNEAANHSGIGLYSKHAILPFGGLAMAEVCHDACSGN